MADKIIVSGAQNSLFKILLALAGPKGVNYLN